MSLGPALLLALCGLAQLEDPGTFGIALLRLEGPCEGASIEAGGPRTRVLAPLERGEVRTIPVPIQGLRSMRPDQVRVAAVPERAGGGSAHLVGWQVEPGPAPLVGPGSLAGSDPPAPGDLRALERLARRTRPPLAPPRPRAGGGDCAFLAALLLVILALRRRPRAALLAGVGGAILVASLPQAGADPVQVRVLEGDLPAGLWLELRAGLGSLELEPGELAVPRTRSEAHEHSYLVDLRAPQAPRWRALAPGQELHLARSIPQPGVDLERNRLGRLDPLWIRGPDGRWERREAWEPGAPLPPPAAPDARGGAGPPAWLASALPQGRSVLVAGLAAGGGEGRTPTWVRALGP